MALPAALKALEHRDFRVYWMGQAVSLVGTWMQMMAQGWVVTELSTDAFVLGLLNAAGSLPIMLLSLKGGELADRLEKRRILVATQIAMMFLAFAMAALVFAGVLQLWHVFALAILTGITTAFDLPAAQSMPPELVEPKDIPNAVALMQAVFHGARLVGPAVAGILIARFGRGSAFVANGVSFLAVIGTLLVLKPRPKKAGGPGKGKGSIGEGWTYVKGEPAVKALIGLTTLITAFVFPFMAVLMVYYVRYALGTDDAQVMGMFMSVSGLGSVVGAGAILTGAAGSRRVWLVGGVIGAAIGIAGLSLVQSVPFAVACSGLVSFSVSSLMGRISQMIQERVPGELRGRVMGIFSISFTGMMPLASLLWSFLADRLGHATGYVLVMRVSAVLFAVLSLGVLARSWSALAPQAPEPEPAPAS